MANPELNIQLKLNDKASKKVIGIIKSMKSQNVQLASSQKKVNTAVNGTTNAFRTLGRVFVGLAIVKGIKDTAKAAIDFESAFAGVRKTVDATEAEFDQLSKNLRGLSREIPVAVTELARIQELAGQLGVDGVKELTKFTETIAKISVTTNLTSESASTNFARIANIMQTPLQEVDRLGASVVDLGNNFATTEAEIVEFAQRIAGAGKVVGLSEADIFAFGAAFSSVGVRAERGGTAVSKALIKIGDAVENGGEELALFAEISGQTIDDFQKGWKEDAGKSFALFIEGLGKAGLKGASILRDLELGDQRLVQSFLSVGGASGILTRALDKSNRAYEENSALNEEAAKRFGTTASKVQLIKNNITDLQIEIGTKLLPVFDDLLKLTVKYVDLVTGSDLKFTEIGTKLLPVFKGLLDLTAEYFDFVTGANIKTTKFDVITDAIKKQRKEVERLNDAFKQNPLLNDDALPSQNKAREEQRLRVLEDRGAQALGLSSNLDKQPSLSDSFKDSGLNDPLKAIEDENSGFSLGGGGGDFGGDPAKAQQKLNDTLASLRAQDSADVAQNEKKKMGSVGEFFKGILGLSRQDQEDKRTASESTVSIFGSTMDGLFALQQAGGKKSGKLHQALSIGEAVISTAAGVSRALKDFPFPINLAIGAIVGAAGAAQIASISSVKFHDGGLIGGKGEGAQGEVGITAQTGEGILSRRGVQALGAGNLDRLNNGESIGGGGGGVTINISTLNLSGVSAVEDFGDMIATQIERGTKYPRG